MTDKKATIYLDRIEGDILELVATPDIKGWIISEDNVTCYITATEQQLSDLLYFMWKKDIVNYVGYTASRLRDKLNGAGRNIFNW